MGGLFCVKETMKIGVYCGPYKPHAGGAFSFQHVVISALEKCKSNHSFYLFSGDEDIQNVYPGLPVVKFKIDKPKNSLVKKIVRRLLNQQVEPNPKQIALQNALCEKSIDLMWFLTPENYKLEVPYIFTVWDLQHRLQPYFPEVSFAQNGYEARERLYSTALPRAAYIIVGNEVGKEEIERFYGVPSWRIKVNPMPTPPFVFDASIKPSNIFECFAIKRPYLFYPAQFWPHKNHVVILHAVKILKEKYGKVFDVVFTGSDAWNMKYIKKVVADLGLQESVHFLGFVETDVLVGLYRNAYALVYASFFGPDNIPPLEAFGLRCPVIAARVSGAQYQLEGAAFLFDPSSEQELVEKILQLQGEEQTKRTFLAEGVKRARECSGERYIERMLKNFDEFEPIRRCWSSDVPYGPA